VWEKKIDKWNLSDKNIKVNWESFLRLFNVENKFVSVIAFLVLLLIFVIIQFIYYYGRVGFPYWYLNTENSQLYVINWINNFKIIIIKFI